MNGLLQLVNNSNFQLLFVFLIVMIYLIVEKITDR